MNTQAAAERVRYAVTGEGALDLRERDYQSVWRAARPIAVLTDDGHVPPVVLFTEEQVRRYARELDQDPASFKLLWGVPVKICPSSSEDPST